MTAEAEFESKCAECGDTIKVGSPIVKVEGEWIHEDCADDPRDLRFNTREEGRDG